jgi:hypothetical protein
MKVVTANDARLPPSTVNLLPQATLSGNLHTILNASGAPDPYVRWVPDSDGSVRLIRQIDPEAMKKDLFDTLNGSPTPLKERP